MTRVVDTVRAIIAPLTRTRVFRRFLGPVVLPPFERFVSWTSGGRVQVSALHANFLVNPGGVGRATAQDVVALIKQIQTTVAQQFGVQLEPEVQLVGDWETGRFGD